MTERENNVYKAKLAEQAERYDGKCTKRLGLEKIFSSAPEERQPWGGVRSLRCVVAWSLKSCRRPIRPKLFQVSQFKTRRLFDSWGKVEIFNLAGRQAGQASYV